MDGRAVHVERPRQLPRGREARSFVVPALPDVADQGVGDGPVERDRGPASPLAGPGVSARAGVAGIAIVPKIGLGLDQGQTGAEASPNQMERRGSRLLAARRERGVGAFHLLGEEEVPLPRSLGDFPGAGEDLLPDLGLEAPVLPVPVEERLRT